MCRVRRECWTSPSRSSAAPTSDFTPRRSSGWARGRRIWRRWSEGCTCAGSRPRMSVRCMARRSARAALSKSTVSRVTQQLNQEFDTWRRRDLSDLPIVYLFLNGQYHAARQGTNEKEGVLSAYALLEDGRPVLVHLDLGPRESSDAWLSFLQDLTARGLKDPLLVVMDGAPGLVKAIKRVWPHACRQRCQVHKMRNILSKLPRMMQPKMKALVPPSLPRAELRRRPQAGPRPHRPVQGSLHGGDGMLGARPRGMCHPFALSRGPSSADSHHQSPGTAQRESRRRTKVIPRFPTERSCTHACSTPACGPRPGTGVVSR